MARVWRDDELIAAGLGNKTGQGMDILQCQATPALSRPLAGLGIDRKIFLHINIPTRRCARFRRARNSRARRLANSADGTEITRVNAMTAFHSARA